MMNAVDTYQRRTLKVTISFRKTTQPYCPGDDEHFPGILKKKKKERGKFWLIEIVHLRSYLMMGKDNLILKLDYLI